MAKNKAKSSTLPVDDDPGELVRKVEPPPPTEPKKEEEKQDQDPLAASLVHPGGMPKFWAVFNAVNGNQVEFLLNAVEERGYECVECSRNKADSWHLRFKRVV